MGWAILKKFLIQFSVEGQGCIPSLLFDLRPNYGGGNEESGDLLQKVPCMLCLTQCPQTCCRHCQRLATADPRLCQRLLNTHPQVWVTLLWGHCSFLLGPGVYKVLFMLSKCVFPHTLCNFCNQIPLTSKVKFPGTSQSLCQIPSLGNLLWVLEIS